MRRTARRRLATAALVAVLALPASACTWAAGTRDASLAELTQQQESWDGQRTRVQGMLRSFDDPVHYWIEDEDLNRLELVPHDGLEPLVGARIQVEGVFTFKETEGRRIQVEELTALDGSTGR